MGQTPPHPTGLSHCASSPGLFALFSFFSLRGWICWPMKQQRLKHPLCRVIPLVWKSDFPEIWKPGSFASGRFSQACYWVTRRLFNRPKVRKAARPSSRRAPLVRRGSLISPDRVKMLGVCCFGQRGVGTRCPSSQVTDRRALTRASDA